MKTGGDRPVRPHGPTRPIRGTRNQLTSVPSLMISPRHATRPTDQRHPQPTHLCSFVEDLASTRPAQPIRGTRNHLTHVPSLMTLADAP